MNKLMKKIIRLRHGSHAPTLPNDCAETLKLCANDVAGRIPVIIHKINVVQTNIEVVPFMKDGLVHMKNELIATLNLQNNINNLLEKYRLNI